MPPELHEGCLSYRVSFLFILKNQTTIMKTQSSSKMPTGKLTAEEQGEFLYFYVGKTKIGEAEWYFSEESSSHLLPQHINDFYLAHIEVYEKYRGHRLSVKMLDYIKDFAEKMGARLISLRIDYGMGYTKVRNPENHLDKLYLQNGFEYTFSVKECELDDEKELGGMTYYIIPTIEH